MIYKSCVQHYPITLLLFPLYLVLGAALTSWYSRYLSLLTSSLKKLSWALQTFSHDGTTCKVCTQHPTHTHTHTHMHTHIYTHNDMHTYTHTHTQRRGCNVGFSNQRVAMWSLFFYFSVVKMLRRYLLLNPLWRMSLLCIKGRGNEVMN